MAQESRILFSDDFSDGAYEDTWYHPSPGQPSDVEITEGDSSLHHVEAHQYGEDIDLRTTEEFDSSGVVRISFRMEILDPGFWGCGITLRTPNNTVELLEHKWEGFDRFAVFGVEDRPDKYSSDYDAYGEQTHRAKLASAADQAGVRDYSITVDLDSGTVTQVTRDEKRWDLSLPAGSFTEDFWIEIGSGGGHDVRYHEVKIANGGAPIEESTTKPPTSPSTESTTETTTEPRTERPVNTPIETKTKAKTEVPYRVEGAELYRRVTPGDITYEVRWRIPGADPSRRVVVDPDTGNVVSPAITRDVLMTDMWVDRAYPYNWGEFLETAKDMRTEFGAHRFLLNAQEIAAKLTVAAIVAKFKPSVAVGTFQSALEDAINWGTDAVDEPYREAFTKMDAAMRDVVRVKEKASDITSLSEFDTSLSQISQLATGSYNKYQETENVTEALVATKGLYDNVYTAIDFFRQANAGTLSSGTVLNMALDEVITSTVNTLTGGIGTNAAIAGIGKAMSTAMITLSRDVREYKKRAVTGKLSPAEIVAFERHRQAHHYIGAVGNQAIYKLMRAIKQSSTGAFWGLIMDSAGGIENVREHGETYRWAANATQVDFGEWRMMATTRYQNSINYELFAEGGKP